MVGVKALKPKEDVPDTHRINQEKFCALWHIKMGHANSKVIDHMSRDKKYSMGHKNGLLEQSCDTCVQTKQTSVPAKGSLVDNSKDLTIHADICGPFRTQTFVKKVYFATMTSTPDRYTKAELLTHRNEPPQFCRDYIAWIERQSGQKVMHFHTDNAKELPAKQADLRNLEMILTTTSPYTLEFNSHSERMNRSLLDEERSLLKEAKMNLGYWREVLLYDVYLHNRTITPTLGMRTPYEMLFKQVVESSRIRVLGCTAYVPIRKPNCTSNLGKHLEKAIYLGNRDGLHRL